MSLISAAADGNAVFGDGAGTIGNLLHKLYFQCSYSFLLKNNVESPVTTPFGPFSAPQSHQPVLVALVRQSLNQPAVC